MSDEFILREFDTNILSLECRLCEPDTVTRREKKYGADKMQ